MGVSLRRISWALLSLGALAAIQTGCDDNSSGQGGAGGTTSAISSSSSTGTTSNASSSNAGGSTATSSSSSSSSGTGGAPPTAQHVYVTRAEPGTPAIASSLVGFDVAADGGLAPIAGSPFSLGENVTSLGPLGAAMCGGYLYIGTGEEDGTTQGIQAFGFDGAGAPLPAPTTHAPHVNTLACLEDAFLFSVVDLPSEVEIGAYKVLPDGSLAGAMGAYYSAQLESDPHLEPNHGKLFAFNFNTPIRVFTVDPTTGALSNPPVPSWPQDLPFMDSGSVSPDGKWFVYTGLQAESAGSGERALHSWSVGADGVLTVVPPAEYIDPAHLDVTDVFWVGPHLFVATFPPYQLLSYDISASGVISLPSTSALDLGTARILQLVADPSGSRAYALLVVGLAPQQEFSVAVLDISATGKATFATGSPLSIGATPATHILVR